MEITNGGKELKRLRQIAGQSQAELGKLAGIARSRISSAECSYCELTDSETVRAGRVIRSAISENSRVARTVVKDGSPSPSGV
jgi:transcriptional regulator with XRE-family HTH domain